MTTKEQRDELPTMEDIRRWHQEALESGADDSVIYAIARVAFKAGRDSQQPASVDASVPAAWYMSGDPDGEQTSFTTSDGILASSYSQLGWKQQPLYLRPAAEKGQADDLPPSVEDALEFYNRNSCHAVPCLKSKAGKQRADELRASSDWEEIGDTYAGDPQFVVRGLRAEKALDDLQTWKESRSQPTPSDRGSLEANERTYEDGLLRAAEICEERAKALDFSGNEYVRYPDVMQAANIIRKEAAAK